MDRYDLFISYSRADADVVEAVRHHLVRLDRPWWRRRSMRVFVDEASLGGAHSLDAELVKALDASDCLLVVASPSSAGSAYVDWEIRHWLSVPDRAHRLLVAAADDRVAGKEAGADAWASLAIPPALREAFASPPLWVDLAELRGRSGAERGSLARHKAAKIASGVRGIPLDEIWGDDLQERRRNTRWAVGAIVTLGVLLIVAIALGWLARRQRDEAVRQLRFATARQLMSEADGIRGSDPLKALRLGIAAYSLAPDEAVRLNLLATMTSSRLVGQLAVSTGSPLVFHPDRPVLVARSAAGVVMIDVRDASRPTTTALPDSDGVDDMLGVAVSPDGQFVAAFVSRADRSLTLRLWDITDSTQAPEPWHDVETGRICDAQLAFSHHTGRLAIGDSQGFEIWDLTGSGPKRVAVCAASLALPVSGWGFSSDDRALRVVSDGMIRSWDATSDRYSPDALHPGGSPAGSVAGLQGDLVVSQDDSGVSVRRLDPVGGVAAVQGAVNVDLRGGLAEFGLSIDGRVLAVAGLDSRVSVFDGGQPRIVVEHRPSGWGEYLSRLAVSTDGKLLATSDLTGRVLLWDLNQGLTSPSWSVDGTPERLSGLVVTKDGTLFAAAATDRIYGWRIGSDGPDRQPSMAIDEAKGPIVPGADGLLHGVSRAAATRDRPIIWRVHGRQVEVVAAPELFSFAPVFAQTLSPNGRLLAVGGYSGVAVFDVTNPTRPVQVAKDQDTCGVACLALDFSPDGRLLAAGTRSQAVAVWQVNQSGQLTLLGPPLEGTGTSLSSVHFSPRGDLLVGIDQSGNVLAWAVNGRTHPSALAQLLPSSGGERSAAFSDDGSLLAITDGAGSELFAVTSARQVVRVGRVEGVASAESIAFGSGLSLVSSGAGRLTGWDLHAVAERLQGANIAACAIAKQGLTRDEWESRIPGLDYRDPCAPLSAPG